MPELPEVEVLRLGLVKKVLNKKINSVKVLKPKIVSGAGTKRKENLKKVEEFEKEILNEKIIKINRIAKNIILKLTNKKIIIIHLKMTGQLVFIGKDKKRIIGGHPILNSQKEILPSRHTSVIFKLSNGDLFYNDIRMFGYVLYYKNEKEMESSKRHFKNLGLDPFDKNFTLTYFVKALKEKRKSIKSVLLEQSVVVGCGNIYADEACFASKILPKRSAASLSKTESSLLFKNIKNILKKAILYGGSSVSNYLLLDGSKGNFAKLHKVYGRYGKACKACGEILEKAIISNRTTTFCKNCQK